MEAMKLNELLLVLFFFLGLPAGYYIRVLHAKWKKLSGERATATQMGGFLKSTGNIRRKIEM
jgi:hypothetical protein